MKNLYYWCERALMWGVVLFSIGLVVYLAYRQYRTMKHRRRHHRHRARQAMRRSGERMAEHRPNHNHQS